MAMTYTQDLGLKALQNIFENVKIIPDPWKENRKLYFQFFPEQKFLDEVYEILTTTYGFTDWNRKPGSHKRVVSFVSYPSKNSERYTNSIIIPLDELEKKPQHVKNLYKTTKEIFHQRVQNLVSQKLTLLETAFGVPFEIDEVGHYVTKNEIGKLEEAKRLARSAGIVNVDIKEGRILIAYLFRDEEKRLKEKFNTEDHKNWKDAFEPPTGNLNQISSQN